MTIVELTNFLNSLVEKGLGHYEVCVYDDKGHYGPVEDVEVFDNDEEVTIF